MILQNGVKNYCEYSLGLCLFLIVWRLIFFILFRHKADTGSLILGLDLDWPSAYKSVFKTKQIHICSGENECAILNVSNFKFYKCIFYLWFYYSKLLF